MDAKPLDLHHMSPTEDINTLIVAAGGLATTVIAWLTGRKSIQRSETDNDGAQLDNVAKAISIWEDTATKLNQKVNDLQATNETVLKKLETLKQQHEECEHTKSELSEKVSCLEGDVCKLKAKIEP